MYYIFAYLMFFTVKVKFASRILQQIMEQLL